MIFTEEAWKNNQDIYDKIIHMPFNQELKDGTLNEVVFRDYIIQDAHYLEGFARALSAAAAKAQNTKHIVFLSSAAYSTIIEERALHETYLKEFSITDKHFQLTEPSPICELYVSYLMKLSYQSAYEVLLAGLLPCFWIYLEVGKWMAKMSITGNAYQEWINAYSSPEFEDVVKNIISITDDVARKASREVYDEMHHAYTKAAKLEWMFWDSAYHQRTWPL